MMYVAALGGFGLALLPICAFVYLLGTMGSRWDAVIIIPLGGALLVLTGFGLWFDLDLWRAAFMGIALGS